MKIGGLPAAGHTGGQQGTATAFRVVPSKNAGVAVLANMDGADSTALADELAGIVLGL
jgi:CubicO group peptidase (beta-lactamase class C family)